MISSVSGPHNVVWVSGGFLVMSLRRLPSERHHESYPIVNTRVYQQGVLHVEHGSLPLVVAGPTLFPAPAATLLLDEHVSDIKSTLSLQGKIRV